MVKIPLVSRPGACIWPPPQFSSLKEKSFGLNDRYICALTGLSPTRRERSTGTSDKCPVPAHYGRTTCAQEALFFSTKNILPRHRFLPGTPYVQLKKCNIRTTVISCEQECLLTYTYSIPEEERNTKNYGKSPIVRRTVATVFLSSTAVKTAWLPERDECDNFVTHIVVTLDLSKRVCVHKGETKI